MNGETVERKYCFLIFIKKLATENHLRIPKSELHLKQRTLPKAVRLPKNDNPFLTQENTEKMKCETWAIGSAEA